MKNAERTFTIVNKLGLHARAAARLVQTAAKFKSDIQVEREGQTVNGKSIMGVLMLAAAQGTQVTVRTAGDDADQAMDALGALIEDGFGEDKG
jgi:phosphocarrier protein